MKAYEIHTFKDSVWKIDSVFDDRDLALHEANKIDEGSRYAAVRVIEENYDEVSDLTTTRTIFRGTRAAKNKRAEAPAPKPKPVNHGPRNTGGQTRRRRPQPQAKQGGGFLVPILILLIIVFAGIAGMLLLRQAA